MINFARILFHVTEFEKNFRRKHHRNIESENGKWIWQISENYFKGYNLGLSFYKNHQRLKEELDQVENSFRGFAYEGAGTALTLLDAIRPWKRNGLNSFIQNHAQEHIKTTYAGVGLALARLGLSLEKRLAKYDAKSSEYIIDGYAFYFGCLKNSDYQKIQAPKWMNKTQSEVFTRGLGRSMWFRHNGDVQMTYELIKNFSKYEQKLLWKGFGIACAYAGKVNTPDLEVLKAQISGQFHSFAMGVEIAYNAREIADIQTPYTASVFKDAYSLCLV